MSNPLPVDLRRVTLVWFVTAIVVQIVLSALLNLVVFPGGYLNFLIEPTGALVQPTLLANLISITVVLVLVVGLGGGLRPRNLGLRWADVPAALGWLIGLWLAVHAVFAVVLLVQGKPLDVAGSFGSTRTTGSLIGQLFGNALFEEIFFRAFLMTQFWLWLANVRRRLTWTLIWSQLLFAVAHVPNRIMKGTYESLGDVARDQAMLVVMGLLMAWMWLRTRNLLAVVAMHALVNYAPALFDGTSRGDLGGGVTLITLVVLIGWQIRSRRTQA